MKTTRTKLLLAAQTRERLAARAVISGDAEKALALLWGAIALRQFRRHNV